MAIKLNQAGYDRAAAIIKKGLEVENDTNNWQEVKPTVDEELFFIENHSLNEYGEWFLGVNTDAALKDSTKKFVYPHGDLKVVHKSALLESEKLAKKNNDTEIHQAIHKLLEMIK